MKLYDFEDILTEQYGEIGTPRRDKFERQVDEAVHAYRIGEAGGVQRGQTSVVGNWLSPLALFASFSGLRKKR